MHCLQTSRIYCCGYTFDLTQYVKIWIYFYLSQNVHFIHLLSLIDIFIYNVSFINLYLNKTELVLKLSTNTLLIKFNWKILKYVVFYQICNYVYLLWLPYFIYFDLFIQYPSSILLLSSKFFVSTKSRKML